MAAAVVIDIVVDSSAVLKTFIHHKITVEKISRRKEEKLNQKNLLLTNGNSPHNVMLKCIALFLSHDAMLIKARTVLTAVK